MPGYFEKRELRYGISGRAPSDHTTAEESMLEARVSDLGEYLFRNWPKEIGYMPGCDNIYHIARAVIRGGWRAS